MCESNVWAYSALDAHRNKRLRWVWVTEAQEIKRRRRKLSYVALSPKF